MQEEVFATVSKHVTADRDTKDNKDQLSSKNVTQKLILGLGIGIHIVPANNTLHASNHKGTLMYYSIIYFINEIQKYDNNNKICFKSYNCSEDKSLCIANCKSIDKPI